jgi:hypothetical protein
MVPNDSEQKSTKEEWELRLAPGIDPKDVPLGMRDFLKVFPDSTLSRGIKPDSGKTG